ncbi:heavy metal-binding domain-containing protein, partial [Enterococcus faecium]
RPKAIGADANIGVKMHLEELARVNGMLMVTCSGTAVTTR